jgi:hypothetical protein
MCRGKQKENKKMVNYLKGRRSKFGMYSIYSVVMIVFFSTTKAQAYEIGVALGLNTSAYKSWDNNRIEYQKTNLLNPIEVTFQKDLFKFLGINSTLRYSKKSFSESIQTSQVSENGIILPGEMVKYEKDMNYLSLEISPIFFYKLKKFLIDARFGASGDFYINEWTDSFGEKTTLHSEEANSFVLSFVGGIGLGYSIRDKFKIGLRSSISRTITNIYKNQSDDADIFYLNYFNVMYFSFLF